MNSCKHQNKYVDRYKTICADCGLVLEENEIVNELNYGENGAGTFVNGQFINIDTENATVRSSGRSATILKFDRFLKTVAEKLQLDDNLIDKARTYYIMALKHKLTQARRSDYVAAVLLAIVCRQQELPYLLIDFADIFKVNIKEFSSAYLALSEELQLQLPIQQPSIFVERFCNSVIDIIKSKDLDFTTEHFTQKPSEIPESELKAQLYQTVNQLVKVMQFLNIHVQRKPQLIVGVALYLALLNMNIMISPEQIAELIYMSPQILRKKINDVVNHGYFANNNIQQILSDTDCQIVKQYLMNNTNNISQKILQKRNKRYVLQNNSSLNNKQYVKMYENHYIYEISENSHEDEQENEQELNQYFCEQNQIQKREQIFDNLYKDNLEYYIEKRKLQKTGTRAAKRSFQSIQEGILSVSELPRESREGILNLITIDSNQQEQQQPLVNQVNNQEKSDIYEYESEQSTREVVLL